MMRMNILMTCRNPGGKPSKPGKPFERPEGENWVRKTFNDNCSWDLTIGNWEEPTKSLRMLHHVWGRNMIIQNLSIALCCRRIPMETHRDLLLKGTFHFSTLRCGTRSQWRSGARGFQSSTAPSSLTPTSTVIRSISHLFPFTFTSKTFKFQILHQNDKKYTKKRKIQ